MESNPVAFFAALADEIRIPYSKMHVDERVFVGRARIARGTYHKKPVMVIRTGVGRDAMGRAAAYCLDHYALEACFNVGYCGGARPHLMTGDIVIADRVAHTAGDDVCTVDPAVVERAAAVCAARGLRHYVGGVATVDSVVNIPHEKAFIGTHCDAVGIDMESMEFARGCGARGASWGVVRAVLDPLDMTLPALDGAVDEDGRTDILGAVKGFMKHPKDILAIPRVEFCAVKAREAIASFIEGWLKE